MTRYLILWLTGLTILLWICASALGAIVMRDEFDEVFDSALSETAQRLLPLVIDDIFRREDAAGPLHLPDSHDAENEEYLTYQVRDSTGAVLLHSHDASADPFDAPLEPGYHDTATHRVFTATAVSGTIVLQVADPLAHRMEAMREGVLALLLPILPLVPLSVVAVWLVVRRALRPIAMLGAEIEKRSGANLEPLSPGSMPPELARIAASVDGLLERLRKTIEAERSFSANSAHELRTPLAGALAQTQRLIEEVGAGPARDRAPLAAWPVAAGREASATGAGRVGHRQVGQSRAAGAHRPHGRGGSRVRHRPPSGNHRSIRSAPRGHAQSDRERAGSRVDHRACHRAHPAGQHRGGEWRTGHRT